MRRADSLANLLPPRLGPRVRSLSGVLDAVADEIRLYRTALPPPEVKSLVWFLHGANNVILPRGVFYESRLYGKLNGSFGGIDNGPLEDATAYGNSNTLTSNLNSRVIQMVITKNLTLAQAWGTLDLARTQNGTTNVTSFPFFATSEFYTLGFVAEVNSLSANTSVVNGGNWTISPPPPPPNLWQLFWNTIAGVAAYVWNAAVAVGAFFQNLVKWLVDAAIGITVGLTTGNWDYFRENVVEPFREAFEAFLDAVVKLMKAMVEVAIGRERLEEIRAGAVMFGAAVASILTTVLSEYELHTAIPRTITARFGELVFASRFALGLLLVSGILTVAVMAVTYALMSFPFVIPLIPLVVAGFVAIVLADQVPAITIVPGLPKPPTPEAAGEGGKQLAGCEGDVECERRALLVDAIAALLKDLAGFAVFAAFVLARAPGAAAFFGLFYGAIAMVFAVSAAAAELNHLDATLLSVVAIVVGVFGMIFDVVGFLEELGLGNIPGATATGAAFLISAMAISLALAALAARG